MLLVWSFQVWYCHISHALFFTYMCPAFRFFWALTAVCEWVFVSWLFSFSCFSEDQQVHSVNAFAISHDKGRIVCNINFICTSRILIIHTVRGCTIGLATTVITIPNILFLFESVNHYDANRTVGVPYARGGSRTHVNLPHQRVPLDKGEISGCGNSESSTMSCFRSTNHNPTRAPSSHHFPVVGWGPA